MLSLPISTRIDSLVTSIVNQFNNRVVVENTKRKKAPSISLNTAIKDDILWLHFTGTQTFSITIQLPFIENGVTFIKDNEVVRAVCNYWMEKDQIELDYLAIMYNVVCANTEGIVHDTLTKGYPFIQQMIFSFENGNPSIIAHRFQRAINEITNKMPLHTTNLNSWIMNNRLMIIDETFKELRSPKEILSYQVNKANKYFDKGWTQIGLSDGSLSSKNHTLNNDLRKLSPFGIRYHNPQRNLYSTLGMQGDELPMIRSSSMQSLMDQGTSRTGWNLFTLFADVQDVFEDQIIVDSSHRNKYVTYTKRYQIFGRLLVDVGSVVRTGDKLGISPDDEPVLFSINCDFAKVKKICKTTTNVGNEEVQVYNVIVEYQQKFKDGVKLTNVHGNKGVIRLMELGYAIDPLTGKERKIDIIVGAKTVEKRKNYGQILEAIVNCVLEPSDWTIPKTPIVIPDEWCTSAKEIKATLKKRGFNEDGTWLCNTPYGELRGICGRVFWGCIKTPENQVWNSGDTTVKDNKGIRRAGLKFSHVEIRALKTRFTDQNPIIDEIMSYAQGSENLQELLGMIGSKTGSLPANKPIVNIDDVKPLDQLKGTIVPGQYINGTVVDEFFMPGGFIFKLPMQYQTLVGNNDEILYEGFPRAKENIEPQLLEKIVTQYLIDRIYIPSGILRKCWRHDSGRYGLSDIGTIVNNVVTMSIRLVQDLSNDQARKLYYIHLQVFFKRLSTIIGTKRGQISNCGMSVRYPFSAKATATLSTTLPRNTIEIHRTMADQINVKNGDIVIVERFPCLGFMSIRPQKVHVTDDIMCKYTIRVSGNSLVSQNLDFDGDTLFIASFHTPEAKLLLNKEWANPNPTCYNEIKRLNARKGSPHIKCYCLDDYKIMPFHNLTNAEHSIIVEKNTGIKAQTGPIIALTYNIMRIVENSDLERNQKLRVGVEVFLEKAAQSVFEQKHGGQSLHELVIDSICTGNVENLVKEGFQRSTTTMLVSIIKKKAASLGIMDLIKYHDLVKVKNTSNIISLIVREQNRIYFASRSEMDGVALLRAINEQAVDIPSKMFKWIMSGRTNVGQTELEKYSLGKKLETFNTTNYMDGCSCLCNIIHDVLDKQAETPSLNVEHKSTTGEYRYAETTGHRR